MKKFHIHLDATLVITAVFALSLGMNYYQHKQYQEVAQENVQLAKKNVIGKLNLESCRQALPKIDKAKQVTTEQ